MFELPNRPRRGRAGDPKGRLCNAPGAYPGRGPVGDFQPRARQLTSPAFGCHDDTPVRHRVGPPNLEDKKMMVNYISAIVFVVLLAPGIWLVTTAQISALAMAAWVIADLLVASSIRLAAEWQRAVVFRAGKLSSVKG